MAKQITCDFCHNEPAEIMYSTFTDGSTIAVGALCAPVFVMGLAVALGIMPDPTEVPADVPAPQPVAEESNEGEPALSEPEPPKRRPRRAQTPA